MPQDIVLTLDVVHVNHRHAVAHGHQNPHAEVALARQTEPEREADQGPEHPTVLANRAEKAEIEEEKTAVLAEAIAHQHQVGKGAKTVIVIIESAAKTVRKGVEDLQSKLARLPQTL